VGLFFEKRPVNQKRDPQKRPVKNSPWEQGVCELIVLLPVSFLIDVSLFELGLFCGSLKETHKRVCELIVSLP